MELVEFSFAVSDLIGAVFAVSTFLAVDLGLTLRALMARVLRFLVDL